MLHRWRRGWVRVIGGVAVVTWLSREGVLGVVEACWWLAVGGWEMLVFVNVCVQCVIVLISLRGRRDG